MITNSQFQAFRKDAIARQPIRKTVLLSDLKFETLDTIKYAGVYLGISRTALKNIVGIIGLQMKGSDNLSRIAGEDLAISVLNSLKTVMSGAATEVIISVTPDRTITKVTATGAKSSLISAESYFETFDRIANNHKLNIQSTNFNSETGSISISTIADNSEHQVRGFNDEVFHAGLNFTRTDAGIQADPYMHRLICTNGMVTRQFEESYKLNSLSPATWTDFYRHLETIEKSGFVPARFNETVNSAIKNPASLAELERGIRLLKSHSSIEDHDLETFFPGSRRTISELLRSGIDPAELTDAQKRNVRTALTKWSVINGVTDFASHNYGIEKKDGADRHLQVQAGDMLAATPDCSNIILKQPF
jgi:hypothetical protein